MSNMPLDTNRQKLLSAAKLIGADNAPNLLENDINSNNDLNEHNDNLK